MDAENQISLLVDRLAGANKQIAMLKSQLEQSNTEKQALEKSLNMIRLSCKALGKDLGQARQRLMRFHRALTWLAHSPTIRLADGTPAWVSKTLNSAMVNDRRPLDNGRAL
ncbi:hypothetical protein [Pseudomonas sp. PNPG3]|uniref:hypothetical protein n=1 Tax=Pseudomonas sp. PNPG3 TaxID=2919497 RepID=UPI001FFCF5BD|nr:hypothetical protein [Pseudomonas sp. PNPG3]MCK2122162.1 hypothetical protein [Pseudomonas sp. PNPG3]